MSSFPEEPNNARYFPQDCGRCLQQSIAGPRLIFSVWGGRNGMTLNYGRYNSRLNAALLQRGPAGNSPLGGRGGCVCVGC